MTLSGRTFVSRMAGSLLEAVGLTDGIVDSLDADVDLSVGAGHGSADRYQAFRAPLDDDAWARTLGDTPAFTCDFEAALKGAAMTPAVAAEAVGRPEFASRDHSPTIAAGTVQASAHPKVQRDYRVALVACRPVNDARVDRRAPRFD